MILLHRSVYVLGGVTIVAVSSALLILFSFFKDSNTEDATSAPIPIETILTTSSSTMNDVEVATSSLPIDTKAAPVENKTEAVKEKIEPSKNIEKNEGTVATQNTTKKAPILTDTSPSFGTAGMLGEHNAARSQVGVGTLSWSKSLALGAQKWSDKLKSEDCKMRHDPNTPYGENIYWAWSSDANVGGLISEPDEAVTMWVNEESFYNYEKNTCKAGEQCGHYTQVVWESTTEVGCGVSSCFDGDAQTDVWVCRYSPAGNDGSRPF